MTFEHLSDTAGHHHYLHQMCGYLAEFSPLPTAVVDGLTHTIIYFNPSFSEWLGKESKNLIGQSFADAIGLLESGRCDLLLDQVYQTNESIQLAEQTPIEGQSEANRLRLAIWPLGTGHGHPTSLMIQIIHSTQNIDFQKELTDINQSLLISSMLQHELTEKTESLNAQLATAINAKNLFLATMSHEIRTPLNAIMGCSELLCLPDQTADSKAEYRSRIKRNAHNLTRLIDDILDLSKMESGKLEINRGVMSLPDLLFDIEATMQAFAKRKNLDFAVKVVGALPLRIVSDSTRLTQILTNMIGNAIKFTTQGSVTVIIEHDQAVNKLRFSVTDTGTGMTAAESGKLFQPFTQIDPSNKRRFGGTGLGLDLARRLARMLGGDIELVKSTPGLGSTFEITVDLELMDPRLEPNELQISLGSRQELQGMRILLAEDAPDNQFLIIEYLSRSGVAVDVAWNGEEAVHMALCGDYDAILMDIQMPILDGYQATSQLRLRGYENPIVALTAHAMHGERERCRLAGCDDYLTKPVTMEKLVKTIFDNVQSKRHFLMHLPASLTPDGLH